MEDQLDITVRSKIHTIRGVRVILDFDIAALYEVSTKVLNQTVRRNMQRFPEDFMFQLTDEEWENLRSQNVTSSWGGTRYLPIAFTEYGIAMLSGLLRSQKAIEVNIRVVRAFIMLRQLAIEHRDLHDKILELEPRCDRKFSNIDQALEYLFEEKREEKTIEERRRIGFTNLIT